jgi:hypothetical protein
VHHRGILVHAPTRFETSLAGPQASGACDVVPRGITTRPRDRASLAFRRDFVVAARVAVRTMPAVRTVPLSLAVLLPFASVRAQAPEATRFDPYAGIDRNNRIEKPQLPEDLPHPERWRYTPPGRIMPGNVLERFLVSSFISPIVFREEDIGAGGGFALTDIDFRGQRFREFANVIMTHSEEGQQAYRINWSRWLHVRDLADGGIVREERNRLYGSLGYEKTLTRRFFGLGSRTAEEAEVSYTEETTAAGFGVRWSLPNPGSEWVARTDLRYEHHGLSAGRVSDRPSIEQVPEFAPLVVDGDGDDQLWFDASLAWDTRDSLSQAYSGTRIGLLANTVWHTGGELGALLGVDAQHVVPLPPLLHRGGEGREENPPTDVIAVGGFVVDTAGDVPFYQLPSLGGGSTLRGYIQNRFTDEAAAHGSLEYRVQLVPRGFLITDTVRIERVGLGVFYEGGTVASGIDRLDRGRYLDSYGLGLRIAFAREALFRVDVGYGREGSNLTIAFGNTF